MARGFKAIMGTVKDDVLKGDHNDGDTIYGLGGNDVIKALNGNDFLFGGDGNDKIYAAGGDDLIWGGFGNDFIDGGTGIDTVAYTDMTGPATVDLAITTAQNTGVYGIDTLINVENLIGGASNDTLRGNALANVLSGQDGDDLIEGRGGNDQLNGGNGGDTLFGGDGNDILTADGGDGASDFIDGGAGIDTLICPSPSAGFGTPDGNTPGVKINLSVTTAQNTGIGGIDTIANVENIIGGVGADQLIGNDGANVIDAGAGRDFVDGGAGDDRVNGFTGSDIVVGGAGNDIVDGGMTGAIGEMDMLYGGAGSDIFLFETLGSSWTGSNDQVMDFSHLEGDRIDIHGVFTNGGFPVGLTASFIGGSAFTGVAGQLQVIKTFTDFGLPGVNQLVNVDWDGNGAADFTLAVSSDALLTVGDFIL